MPAPTQTDIVNAAAALLGSTERIADIAGAGNLALHARGLWDLTVRALLADHPWNFAIAEAPMNAGPAPASERYERSFALPTLCLRLLSIGDEHDWWYPEERAVEGGYVLTDAEAPLYARFISSAFITDCGKWTPHFALTVTDHLAFALCGPLTSEKGVQTSLGERAEASLKRAKRVDGLESGSGRRAQLTRRSNWLSTMHGSYNRWTR